MKIAWVQDNSRPHGGAEVSNRCVVEVGEGMGFDIVGVTPNWFADKALEECDAIILNNFWQFDTNQARRVMTALARKPYVKYEHDHRELRRPAVARQLFRESRLNVFLSPMHLANYEKALMVEGVALPLAIREKDFYPDPAVKRTPKSALIVGGWVRGGKVGRSLQQFMEENPSFEYFSLGIRVPGVKFLPHVSLGEMRKVYSSSERLVHFPDMLCAGERVVFEAALCGCEVFGNDKVGHLSWGFDLNHQNGLRETLRQAPVEFWNKVKEVCS